LPRLLGDSNLNGLWAKQAGQLDERLERLFFHRIFHTIL
jgi:hypothetical protein